MSSKKKVDISELYDAIRERKGSFLVVGDIRSLVPINEISTKAGDLAIITALNRMENAAGNDDIVFRVGGDEFVILTNSDDEAYAEGLLKEIIGHNGECINWEGREIPLSMYARAIRFEGKGPFRYSEFFTMIQDALNDEFKKVLLEEENK